jgi:hypothetical protein
MKGKSMKTISAVLFVVACSCVGDEFRENPELWTEVAWVNCFLSGKDTRDSDSLEVLLQRALAISHSSGLSEQFEDLRTDAFESGDYSLLDRYVERAAPAITILVMGESNSIGVNTQGFFERSRPGTEAYDFFQIAINGFYTDGENAAIGTAELPVWMVRTESSFQAVVDPSIAAEWLGIWESLCPSLDGYFQEIAEETIEGLGDAAFATPEEMNNSN